MPTTSFHLCISVTIVVPYGYSTVTYLRIVAQNGTTFCSFMMGKSCPAPSKFISISISRLQLFDATMASKVDALLRQNLDNVVTDSISWTNSMVVLLMVNNHSKCFLVFVYNCLAQVEEMSHFLQWWYIKDSRNPAIVSIVWSIC